MRELSLEIENHFLLARQDEIMFMDNWRLMGFEDASDDYVAPNQVNLALAWEHLSELETILIHTINDANLRALTKDMGAMRRLLEVYELTFQRTVSQIQELSQSGGLPDSLRAQLDQLGKDVTSWTTLIELIAQMRSDEQAFVASGDQEYADRIHLLADQFKALVQGSGLGDEEKSSTWGLTGATSSPRAICARG